MSIRNAREWDGMHAAGRAIAAIRDRMVAALLPGMTAAELDQMAGRWMRELGVVSAPKRLYGFPGYTCISTEREAAHGIPVHKKVFREGQLINIDVSGSVDGYFADTGISVVLGQAPAWKHTLAAAATEVMQAGIDKAVHGSPVRFIGRSMHNKAKELGYTVIRNLAGHGTGSRLHEPPEILNWENPAERSVLKEGMVLAVESFVSDGGRQVSTAPDGWTLHANSGKWVSQAEHTIVVTKTSPVILTIA